MTTIRTNNRKSTNRFVVVMVSCILLLHLVSFTIQLNLSIIPKSDVKNNISSLSTQEQDRDLTYCSFNIQVFGQKKMQDQQVVEILLKILSKCDLTLVMEIRDASGKAIKDLLQMLKDRTGRRFEISLSERLGRTSSKEQYGFLYDSNKVVINSTWQYPVEFNQFERPPYSILINSSNSTRSKQSLFISGIHTSPKLAVQEIDHLFNVYQYYYQNENGAKHSISSQIPWLLSGDFNAGCSYVKESEWNSIRLRTTPMFKWLIGDHQRTMVKTNCPYDRFVVAGDLQYSDVQIVNFKEEFGLTQSMAEAVSDHFPIRLTIKNWLPN